MSNERVRKEIVQARQEIRRTNPERSDDDNVSLVGKLMKLAKSANGHDQARTWKYIFALEENITQPGMLTAQNAL